MCYICSLVPSLYSYLERSWSFFFFFPFGIPIISPEFHHLFSERPILLNWHLNICWPVHYSRHWSPREGFFFLKQDSLACWQLLGVTSLRGCCLVSGSRRSVWARAWQPYKRKTITAHDSLATNWNVTPRALGDMNTAAVKTYMSTNTFFHVLYRNWIPEMKYPH